ncbi:MAG: hypothetical protein VB101_05185, partial [Rhodospirillaceae bacterium]|nr:hypothetical protein [Rhodospirillaceae bacterium]
MRKTGLFSVDESSLGGIKKELQNVFFIPRKVAHSAGLAAFSLSMSLKYPRLFPRTARSCGNALGCGIT